MLELGSCHGKSLVAEITGDTFQYDGPTKHFHGYKINSGIPGDGVYVEWTANDTSVTITADRLGMLPYFIYHKNNQLIITHDIHDIFEHARDCEFLLDYNSLALQLRLGYFLANDTAFLDIKRLPPNSILEF
jgi:asparagine synthase (glutamine-hydrolysing)